MILDGYFFKVRTCSICWAPEESRSLSEHPSPNNIVTKIVRLRALKCHTSCSGRMHQFCCISECHIFKWFKIRKGACINVVYSFWMRLLHAVGFQQDVGVWWNSVLSGNSFSHLHTNRTNNIQACYARCLLRIAIGTLFGNCNVFTPSLLAINPQP